MPNHRCPRCGAHTKYYPSPVSWDVSVTSTAYEEEYCLMCGWSQDEEFWRGWDECDAQQRGGR